MDRDHKMVRQFQETFHSTYWEIIIYQLCLEAGFSLDQSHPFPDFIVKSPSEFYIEAVVANIKQAGTPENKRTLEDQLSMLIPPHLQKDFSDVLDESIIRSSNAIFSKIKKYEDYKKKSWFDDKNPFVIALSSCDQINYGREFIYPMMALLYGRYFLPYNNGCIAKKAIKKKDVIRDEEDNELPFKFRIVSSSSAESISDGVFIFHNPYAKAPIRPGLFKSTNVTHIFLEDDSLALLGVTTPLYTRFSINSAIAQCIFDKLIMESAMSWNNLTPDNIRKIVSEDL